MMSQNADLGRSVLVESFMTDIGIKPFAGSSYCPGRCSQLSRYLNFTHNGLQHATGTLTYFVDLCTVIKREKSSVLDVF